MRRRAPFAGGFKCKKSLPCQADPGLHCEEPQSPARKGCAERQPPIAPAILTAPGMRRAPPFRRRMPQGLSSTRNAGHGGQLGWRSTGQSWPWRRRWRWGGLHNWPPAQGFLNLSRCATWSLNLCVTRMPLGEAGTTEHAVGIEGMACGESEGEARSSQCKHRHEKGTSGERSNDAQSTFGEFGHSSAHTGGLR